MNGLTTADLEHLAASYITPELARRAGIERVTSSKAKALLNFAGDADLAGLMFPYRWPGDETVRQCRIRPDDPGTVTVMGTTKSGPKYRTASGGTNMLYFPRDIRPEWLLDAAIPVVIVEGEKKTLALHRFFTERVPDGEPHHVVFGLAGVTSWRGRVEGGDGKKATDTIKDFDGLVFDGRRVVIAFDADADKNPAVRSAREGLSRMLNERGATIVWLRWDAEAGKGIDDVLVAKGSAYVAELFERADREGLVGFEGLNCVDPPSMWPDPEPLDTAIPSVLPFEPNWLPDALRPWLVDVAERFQVPMDFAAATAIVGLSAVIGRRAMIYPKRNDNFLVTPNLWGGIVAPPGSLKSPLIAEILRPLYRLQKAAVEAHKEPHTDYLRELMAFEARKAGWKKKAEAKPDLPPFDEDEPNKPVLTRYIVNDYSVEKLHELLAENPQGILLHRDELTGWFEKLDAGGHENDRSFTLECWGGDGSYTIDRLGRGTVVADHLCLSVFGSLQPGKLQAYLSGAVTGGEDDDGLAQRLQMLVYPDEPLTWTDVDRAPDAVAAERAEAIFKRIGSEPFTAPRLFRLDAEAQDTVSDWRADLHRRLRQPDMKTYMRGHLAKYEKLMPAVALIFHLCDAHDKDAVGLTAASRAIEVCRYAESHANRMYGSAVAHKRSRAAILGDRIRTGALGRVFTVSDIRKKGWEGFKTDKVILDALAALEELNWVRKLSGKTTTPLGGKPTERWMASPKVYELVEKLG